jgi:hypothetical protein
MREIIRIGKFLIKHKEECKYVIKVLMKNKNYLIKFYFFFSENNF